jgi:hypothetical protein
MMPSSYNYTPNCKVIRYCIVLFVSEVHCRPNLLLLLLVDVWRP